MQNLKRRFSTVVVLAFSALMVASAAFATADSPEVAAAKSSLDSAKADASNLISYGIPVILGVAIMWVALKFGRKLIARL